MRFARLSLPVAVLAGSAILSPAARAQNYSSQVQFQFRIIKTFAESVGYQEAHKVLLSSLRDDAEETQNLQLEGGWEYRVMGLCDADCSDIDLFVSDPSGTQVGSDTGTSDAPIVNFSAPRDGRYQVRVRMAACSNQPCYYGVAAFGKRLGSGGT
jgi:hypothetical protein